jgi:hypothetical protein
MQHPLINEAMATEHRLELLAECRAAGRRERSRAGVLTRLLARRARTRPDRGAGCLEPRTAC